MKRVFAIAILSVVSAAAVAQIPIRVSRNVWNALSPMEREMVQRTQLVAVLSPTEFGTIIDNQGVDESKPGTTAGAALGGALAQTTYIDRSIHNGNYSATTQLGLGILGTVLGSTLDRKPTAQYHFRYAVKLDDGQIQYFDELQRSAFRHPVGVCVSVPAVQPINQDICALDVNAFKAKYLAALYTPPASAPTTPSAVVPRPAAAATPAVTVIPVMPAVPVPQDNRPQGEASADILVNCKVGTLAPVRTSTTKCTLIGGSITQ